MAHLLTSESKDRDPTRDDIYRLFLITRTEPQADYRFGRTQGKRVHVHAPARFQALEGLLEVDGTRFATRGAGLIR
jgi:hypothetical protein